MPEFKRNFTAGKMNKDLNERLVPKGEYRDAMNIEVSTSEGSDVGTVQNILGNKALEGQDIVPLNSVCVGTVSDEKNDALYWFTTQKSWGSQPYNGVNLTHEDPQGLVNAKRDVIWEYKDNILKPVFCGTGAISYVAYNSSGTNITWDTSNSTITFMDINGTVLAGMDVEIWGYNMVSGVKVEEVFSGFTVRSVSGGNIATIDGDISFLDNSVTTNELKNTKFFLSTADGLSTPLNFDENKIISSINIIDDMLFWSDSYDEPKKINIPRSIRGTRVSSGGVLPTKLLNPARNIDIDSNVACKKEHITVIRRAPLNTLTLRMSKNKRVGLADGIEIYAPTAPFDNRLVGDEVVMFVDTIGGAHPDFKVGDFLKLLDNAAYSSGVGILDNYIIRVSITQKFTGPYYTGAGAIPSFSISSTQSAYVLKIQSIPDTSSTAISSETLWNCLIEDQARLFERKFPRFAYRYKYIDNEYSSFSPFTQVAFLPGNFNYQPIKAHNTGMLNTLRSLSVQDFVTNDMPLDVVQVDILYKNEISPIVYLLNSLTPNDQIPIDKSTNPWNSSGSITNENASKGSLEISTESIYAALPENQTLRSWDNVPKMAIAQEVTGSRIVYGNYTQGYDMKLSNNSNTYLKPDIITYLNSRPITDLDAKNASRSVKSLRSYDIGVVWGDKYGRETPVIASSQGATVIPKTESTSSNYLSVELGQSPYWAEYYKFYIKETSNEYYNLPSDRVYDAEDGNIWVAFPSVDRNKVQEDTYIILKKGVDSDVLIDKEARYKIVAIENEAPEYIKTTYERLARTNTDSTRPPNSCDMYSGEIISGVCDFGGGRNAPTPGMKGFSIDLDSWSGDYSGLTGSEQMGLASPKELLKEVSANTSGSVTDELYVSFSREIDGANPEFTKKYHVVNVREDASDGFYYIHLDVPISSDDGSMVTEDVGVGNDDIHVHFWKKTIINKPEFDGRFFVKILKDGIAEDNLIKVAPDETNFAISATTSLFNITDGNIGNFSPFNTGGQVGVYLKQNGTPSNTGAQSNSTTHSKTQWRNLLKFGTSSRTSRWFIDNATFASKQGGAQNLPSSGHLSYSNVITSFGSVHTCDITSVIGGQTVTGSCPISGTNSYNIMGVGYFYNFPGGSPPSNATHHGDGKSNANFAMRGVHTNGTKNFIDLAYSEFGPDGDGSDGKTTDYNLDWRIGDPNNTSTDQEDMVINNLKPNSIFRIGASQIKYKIKSVTKHRLFNFHGAKRSYNAFAEKNSVVDPNGLCDRHWNDVHVAQVKEMRLEENRRITYRLEYEVDQLLNDVSLWGNTIDTAGQPYDNITETNPETLYFIEPFQTEGENKISADPAIFETEPKEDIDLDIYYEASSSIPVFPITNKSKYSYIPVGTTILPSPTATANASIDLSGVFITGWKNISTSNPKNIITLSYPISAVDVLFLSLSPKVKLLKDNGEIVAIKIIGTEIDANGDVVAFEIEPLKEIGLSWFNCWSFNNGVESNRIGDTFNKPFITNGVTASTTTEEDYVEERRKYGLIYSGIYNSTSGVNELNQFIAAEKITKDINPVYGSIQKLKAGWGQGGDLIALCEDRVLKILANKDALYNADGNTNVTSTNKVLGQTIPYSGEYGISKNPESFASEAYRAYFTDRVRGTVMRLSMDGLTPISDYGMSDWFKDNLKLSNRAVGSFDDKKNEYNISLSNVVNLTVRVPATSKNANQPPFYAQDIFIIHKDYSYLIQAGDIVSGIGIASGSTVVGKTLVGQFYEVELSLNINGGIIGPIESAGSIVNGVPTQVYFWTTTIYVDKSNSHTVTYKEKVKGWVSFKSFIPEQAGSMANDYYTFKDGKAWVHHSEMVPRNTFYFDGIVSDMVYGDWDKSWIEVVINDIPGSVKSFKAVDYEGSQAKVTPNLDANNQLINDGEYFNLLPENGWYVSDFYTNLENGSVTEFVAKEGKWFGHTIGSDISINVDGIINNNYDTSDFSVQGIGGFTSTAINNTIGCMCDGVVNDCFGDGLAAFNYSAAASVPCNSGAPNDCCIGVKPGCIDPLASNFDPLANTDDGSCIFLGCIDEFGPNGILNSNYDPNANASDGSCIEFIPGCTDNTMFNFSAAATIACGGDVPMPGDALGQANNYCCVEVIEGCIDPNADAITPTGANTNNNTCTYTGCTNPLATNYSFMGSTVDGTTGNQADLAYQNGFAVDNGLCLVTVSPTLGCTDSLADNYDATATQDDGSCMYCENITPPSPTPDPNDASTLTNTYFTASVASDETTPGANDGVINIDISVTSPYGNNSVPTLTHSNGTSYTSSMIIGQIYVFSSLPPGTYNLNITQGTSSYVGNQTNPCLVSFNALLTVNPGAAVVNGCTDGGGTFNNHIMSDGSTGTHAACNYNPLATPGNPDAANCEYTTCVGCMVSYATNYDSSYTISDNDTCSYSGPAVYGCIDPIATNYDASANTDDGSCTYAPAAYQVGDTAFGGIIAYFFQSGDAGYVAGEQHGIIVATVDNSASTPWGCYGTALSPNASGEEVGDGSQNTIDILAGCTDTPIAAEIASNYTDGTYTDWFLPSKQELNKVYLGVGYGGTGTNSNGDSNMNIANISPSWYWSSSESGSLPQLKAFARNFNSVNQVSKSVDLLSRSVRYF